MPFITATELKTHLYAEDIAMISRDDDTLLVAAIDGAVQEAKGYLSAFDRAAIFSATLAERNALLLIFVKDIAVWHFINLCNAGSELEVRKSRYDRAVDWLKAVQKGNVSPDLPIALDASGEDSGDLIKFGSNPQRNQHF